VWFIGSEYGEGTDAFELAEEYKKAISESEQYIHGEFVAAIKTIYGDDGGELDGEDLKDMLAFGKVDIVAFNKSHYSSNDNESLEEFFKRYM